MQPMLVCKESDSAWYLMFDALSPLYLSQLPSEYNFLTTQAGTQHICMRVYPCVRIAALFGSVQSISKMREEKFKLQSTRHPITCIHAIVSCGRLIYVTYSDCLVQACFLYIRVCCCWWCCCFCGSFQLTSCLMFLLSFCPSFLDTLLVRVSVFEWVSDGYICRLDIYITNFRC